MAEQTDEKITVTPFYILRQNAEENGQTDFINMTTNIPENTYLHVQMLGYEECTADKKDRLHTFEGYTLHFILKGKGRFDGVSLGKNDGFMVKKNHMAEYAPDPTDPWTYCWINFDGDIADELLRMVGFRENRSTFLLKENNRIRSLILDALTYDYEKTDVGMHLNAVLLEIFSVLLANKPDPFSHTSYSVREKRVKTGLAFIREHYREKNCIERLAKEENVNMRYLSALFRQYSDRSPQAHLIRVRIEEGKRLLRTTSLSVSDIAEEVGYEDVLQFSKLFRKHTGVSPTAYRKGEMDALREYE